MAQQMGLQLLIRQDNIKAGEQEADALRMALLASGTRSVEDLFPQYFPGKALAIDEDAPDDVLLDPNAAFDYSGVTWEGAPGEDEMAMLEQFFGGDALGGSPAFEEPENGGWV